MNKLIICFSVISSILYFSKAQAQIDESKIGAWYMYFYNGTFKESPWGIQGDVQFRNWDAGSDLEQLLIRSGFTYKPKGICSKLNRL